MSKKDSAPRAPAKAISEFDRMSEGVGIIDGSLMTIQETIATTIAKDLIDDAKRATKKDLKDIPAITLLHYLTGRTDNRPVTDGEVMAEVLRLQNHEIYGNKVARR